MIETIVHAGEGTKTLRDVASTLDIETEIARLRREKNAVILAHYYQDGEIQDLADFVGDSLDLSRAAAETDADVIVFCGVRFMAEVAKILSPGKTVLLPDAAAGCSLEDTCRPDAFRAFRATHPEHVAITYINCSAEVKALSDIIVTSANGRTHRPPDSGGQADPVRARPPPRRLYHAAHRPANDAVGRHLHRARTVFGAPNCSPSGPAIPGPRSPPIPNVPRASSNTPITSARPAACCAT